jgi:hypothetical protein
MGVSATDIWGTELVNSGRSDLSSSDSLCSRMTSVAEGL